MRSSCTKMNFCETSQKNNKYECDLTNGKTANDFTIEIITALWDSRVFVCVYVCTCKFDHHIPFIKCITERDRERMKKMYISKKQVLMVESLLFFNREHFHSSLKHGMKNPTLLLLMLVSTIHMLFYVFYFCYNSRDVH